MKVELKIHCRELTGNMEEGIYEMPEGSTTADLIHAAEKKAGFTLADTFFPWTFPVINGKTSQWYDEIHEGDKVTALHIVMGG